MSRLSTSSSRDEILNEDKLRHQLHKMMHEVRKERHASNHKARKQLRAIRKQRESVILPTWQPTSDSGETSTVADGSINISMSRKLTTNEIEIARQKELQQLILDEHRLTVQVKGTQAVGYFEKLDDSHQKGKAKINNRFVRAQSAMTKRDRKKAVERRPYAVHEKTWKMKINAGNLIRTPFLPLGPSPPLGMPILKEGADIWPVLPERTGAGRLPGKPSWYRTTNGHIFGDQQLENFPEHYKQQVIRNKEIKDKNDAIKQHMEEKRLAIEKVRELRSKPKRPWSAAGGGRVFSMLTSIRPPTSLERAKMRALPSRALAGHVVRGNPKWT
tara:strand:- start:12 stop:1001 length:990 start_codon:yes stop_codon:yes gene_type:complete